MHFQADTFTKVVLLRWFDDSVKLGVGAADGWVWVAGAGAEVLEGDWEGG
jgi:hypothetical protein